MKYLIVLSTVLLMNIHNGNAQKLEGQIIDKTTESPLAYVNIGIVELGIGTVSDEKGKFALKVSKDKADSVLFSALGFESVKYSISGLLKEPIVKLNPKSYELKTFDVVDKARGRDKIFGKKKGIPQGETNLMGNSPGDEIGAHIRIKQPTYLKSANFNITRVSGDSMIFRVNIYEFNNGEIGDNLLKENVLLESSQEEGIVTVDLTPYQLLIEQDVLLTLENIDVDLNKNDRGILFKYVPVWFKAKGFYIRKGVNSKNVNGSFLKLLDGVELCFYFVGRELK